jgi:hypothetical protein
MPLARKNPKRARARAKSSAPPPLIAEGSPQRFRVRVRMYRQGLGDCFLVTFPRQGKDSFHILIDCGALGRNKQFMTGIVRHVRDTIRGSAGTGKARLDIVVATHEHQDHVSGFNQARDVFNEDFDIGAVWLGWTENLTVREIKAIKDTRAKAATRIRAALASSLGAAPPLRGVAELLGFSDDDDLTGSRRVAEAMEYLKVRGKDAGELEYLKPGQTQELDGVEGVRVYVLGPPEDPSLLKTSAVTEQMKREGVVYHLASTGESGIDALAAAVSTSTGAVGTDGERYYPFSDEHRIQKSSPYFARIQTFLSKTYDVPHQSWRRIDDDWLSGFSQLALDLDNDTNNTSLALAFEFVKTGEVLLFVGDAQVGAWLSWAGLDFKVAARETRLPAFELLARTVFYKVGHHCSHNATLKAGGLDLMNRDDLVAFIPLDRDTAKKQGKKGWEMPAPALLRALHQKAGKRVVISDVKEALSDQARKAGVRATDSFIDYFLE